nr:transposon protein, putative, unclassified [Oryza sativa Japonica Group]
MEAREKGRAAAGRGGVRGCGGGEAAAATTRGEEVRRSAGDAAAETQVKGEGGGRARRLRLRRRARRSDGRPAMRRRRHGVGGRAAAPWPQLGGNRSWFKLPMLSSQQASYVSEDQQREREFFKPLTMAADRFLHFASLVSVVVLAAGSRSPGGVAALPRRGQLVDGGDNDKNKCVYMLYYMGTGWIWKAGTDAAISVELTAADGSGFAVRDLERWGGLMGAEHDYYERATAASPPDRRTSSPRVVAAAASPPPHPRTPPRPVAALPFSRASIAASPVGRRTSLRRRPPPHRRPALHRVQRGVRERGGKERKGRGRSADVAS